MATAYDSTPNVYGDWKDVEAINPKVPEVATTHLGDVVSGNYPIAGAVNWIYQHIVGPMVGTGDKDLFDLLIKPLTGDFNRIRANGDAWATTGDMYWTIAGNLGQNSAKLVETDWQGEAADAFNGLVQSVWTGALYVAEQCCKWMKKGFDKLADVSIKLATRGVQLLEKIFDLLGKLAKKVIPGWGQLWSIFDWVASGFEDTPYVHEALEIVDLIQTVIGLYDSLKKLVQGIEGYLKNIDTIKDAIGKVPEVNNTHDAVQLGRQFRDSKKDMDEKRKQVDDSAKDIDKKLGDLDQYGHQAQ
ncbi:hypothetical protein [Amycolatopsis samaneae]|uniref:Uncharacterized protein n=1 Tax=Amycolatopsis samaneae TaxID=664691 RepID=A0ABW5GXX0_9PSEU